MEMEKKLEKYARPIAAAALIGLLVLAGIIAKLTKEIDDTSIDSASLTDLFHPKSASTDLQTFGSAEAFEKKLAEIQNSGNGQGGPMMLGLPSIGSMPTDQKSFAAPSAAPTAESSGDFSKTNVQTEGVDEADIVKTDGKYIYTLSRNYLTVTLADPASEMRLVSKTELKNASPEELFIDGDRLMVFGRKNYTYDRPESLAPQKVSEAPVIGGTMPSIYPYPMYSNVAFVRLYDISDREDPKLERNVEFDGTYKTARKIGTDVYFVLNNYPVFYPMANGQEAASKCESAVPMYREGDDFSTDSKMAPIVKCADIHYADPIRSAQFSTVVGISMTDSKKDLEKEVVMGTGDTVYASDASLYLAGTDYGQPGIIPMMLRGATVSSNGSSIAEEPSETTRILKFRLSEGGIAFEAGGSVPGHVLNQFSLDEYGDHLRIATTLGHVSRSGEASSSNNLYVLDGKLNRTGKIEDIAPGEQLYSARFMGDRGYLVTFKKVDPFFTLDLSDPKDPKIAGKLKIPGFSDYLQPYDENHIIGIGKNTVEASDSLSGLADFAWYQGIKMAMFDVTDIENPQEMFKIEIGDRGTDSPILSDHKALLFSKEKNLLVIPILEAKLTDSQKKDNAEGNAYGSYDYQGAYVFSLDLEKGFDLRGRITHFASDDAFKKSGYYFGQQDDSVTRSLFIGDTLYTISGQKILANDLESLDKLSQIDFKLPKMENQVYY